MRISISGGVVDCVSCRDDSVRVHPDEALPQIVFRDSEGDNTIKIAITIEQLKKLGELIGDAMAEAG